MPTRNARHGILYTANGIINIKNAKWKDDFTPIDDHSPAYTSRVHSKAYLRHLFKVEELLAAQIASMHNLAFFLWLVTESRQKIVEGTFSSWKDAMVRQVKTRL